MPSSVAADLYRLSTECTRVSHALSVIALALIDSFVATRDILAIYVLLSRQDHLLR